MKRHAIFLLSLLLSLVSASATQLYFPVAEMTGNTNDVTINVRAVNNPVIYSGRFYYLPKDGTNLTTVNGYATNSFIPGNYIMSIVGLTKSWTLGVTNSSSTLNAVDLSRAITIYSGIQSISGVDIQVVTDAQGRVTITDTNATSSSGPTNGMTQAQVTAAIASGTNTFNGPGLITNAQHAVTADRATTATSATNFANGMPLTAAVTNGYSPTFDLVGELREGYDLSFTNQNRIGLILNTTGTANRSGMTDELRQGGLLFDWDINRPFLYGGSGPGWLQLITDADMSTSHVAVAVTATNFPNGMPLSAAVTNYATYQVPLYGGLLLDNTPLIQGANGNLRLQAESVSDKIELLNPGLGDGSGFTNLNADNIASGTVAPARLGSGSSITTKYLRGDSTWQTISGSGDVVAASQNNFSGSNYFGGNTRFAGTVRITGNLTNDTLTAGSLVKADSNKALTAAVAGTDYLSPSGSGASLTGITASQIGPSGAVSNGQSSVTLGTINGTTLNLTTVNATNFYVWNGAGTFYSTLATAATANRTATLQDGTGTIAWLTDVQNSTNASSLPSTVNATNVTNLKVMLAASSNNWNGSFTGNAAGLTNQVYPINTITLFNTNAAMLTNCESYLVMTNNILFTNWATVAVAGQWGGVWITNSTATDYILHIPTNSMSGNLTNSIGCFVQLGLGNTNWACTISNRQTAELRWRSVGSSLGATHTYVRHW